MLRYRSCYGVTTCAAAYLADVKLALQDSTFHAHNGIILEAYFVLVLTRTGS